MVTTPVNNLWRGSLRLSTYLVSRENAHINEAIALRRTNAHTSRTGNSYAPCIVPIHQGKVTPLSSQVTRSEPRKRYFVTVYPVRDIVRTQPHYGFISMNNSLIPRIRPINIHMLHLRSSNEGMLKCQRTVRNNYCRMLVPSDDFKFMNPLTQRLYQPRT